jgi:hypothetical protein
MKILLVILISCLVISCGNPFILNIKGYVSNGLNEDLNTAWKFTSKFSYGSLGWQSPKEFEKRGSGNCTSFSIDLMYHLGKDSSMLIIPTTDPNIKHAIVKYHGQYIEPQRYQGYYDISITVLDEIDWNTIMQSATNYGTKNIINNSFVKYKFD